MLCILVRNIDLKLIYIYLLKIQNMNFDEYDIYYSLEDLLLQVQKKNIKKEFEQLISKSSQKLFKFSIDNGLVDLAEYCYLFRGVTYNLKDLEDASGIIGTEGNSKEKTESLGTNALKVHSGTGGSAGGLKINFFDPKNKAKNQIFKKLTYLRKYSKMTSKGGNFYFTFVSKYLGRIFDLSS